ncbi:MAG TPA: oxidative damage protection protein [Xanthomonadales bacterium]|nr:oxidative damage protection protein [Xanthomonadales bacterium]
MSRTVHCRVLDKELPGLNFQPYPGELGKRVYEEISAQAWQDWMDHQTMLINEHRLSPINPEHRKFLEAEMQKFLFGEGSEKPAGYVEPVD